MKNSFTLSIYLDTRRLKSNNKFPVKLRVFNTLTREQKYYTTRFDLSEKEYDLIVKNTNPRGINKEIKMQILALENNAFKIANSLRHFNFEEFEKKLFRKKGSGKTVKYHYDEIIKKTKKENKIGTSDAYKCSMVSISKFFTQIKKKNFSEITFYDIDNGILNEYETFMINLGKSYSTIGAYLRGLRAVFNKAISENEIEKSIYPFGKSKYQIPTTTKVKKALTKEELKKLYLGTPSNDYQKKAKDFWFLSYNLNGMNLKDIALLKFKNINGERLSFVREKTKLTARTKKQEITIHLNSFVKSFISNYENQNKSEDDYIFGIVDKNDNEAVKRKKIKNLTRFINQHLSKYSKSIGLPEDISFIWARHSFTTFSINKGASLELIQESLGHQNIKTTQAYFAGFEDETKKELANSLMDF